MRKSSRLLLQDSSPADGGANRLTLNGFDREAAALYLDAVFGGQEGDVLLCFGHDGQWPDGKYTFSGKWQESVRFAWPGDRDRLLGEVAQVMVAGRADVYVCPYLRPAGGRRVKGNAITRRLIHADYDGKEPIDGTLMTQLADLGAFAVCSGSELHTHLYLPLDRPVDAGQHEMLCRSLAAKLGADSKVSDNDVLRLPGTVNCKTIPPHRVTWVRLPTGSAATVEAIRELLGACYGDPPGGSAKLQTGGQDSTAELPGNLPERVQAALAEVTGDRSQDTMRVLGACHEPGMTLAQAQAAVDMRDDLRERLGDRHDDDVLRCWIKIVDDRQGDLFAVHSAAAGGSAELPGEDFWDGHPVLVQIKAAARAQLVGPWALLGAVLARVVAASDHRIVLPPVIGGEASVNLFVGIVAASGDGKGSAERVAESLVPGFVATCGAGTGEGLLRAFVYREGVKQGSGLCQFETNVLVSLPEIDTLAAVAERKGQTILPTLRSAWMGEKLAFQNRNNDCRLEVAPHSYRLGLVAGVQPKRAAVILNDIDGGLTQRFLFLPGDDPDLPADEPDDWEPGEIMPLKVASAQWSAGGERRAVDV